MLTARAVPELPEVEVVRAGLAPALTGASVTGVHVIDPRALKRHVPSEAAVGVGGVGVSLDTAAATQRRADFERRLIGARFEAPLRRGKFMWIPVTGAERLGRSASSAESPSTSGPGEALLAHLGMSGQLLLRTHDAPDDAHTRIRLWIEHPECGELRLDFADQRLFGSLAIDRLAPSTDGLDTIPAQAVHIARDPLDPNFDDAAFIEALRRRAVGVKKLLLDQTVLSGVGNIYADEALWQVQVHPETAGSRISRARAVALLEALRAVFSKALAEGGTSFDAQYVNVNGQAGYFAHSLNAYGRAGQPCSRCGTVIKRVPFGGRSSHFCPRCQRNK